MSLCHTKAVTRISVLHVRRNVTLSAADQTHTLAAHTQQAAAAAVLRPKHGLSKKKKKNVNNAVFLLTNRGDRAREVEEDDDISYSVKCRRLQESIQAKA